jgi:thymidylate synthase (FAD)
MVLMKVELLKCFGDDEMVVEVARVSYKKLAKMFTVEENDKLIYYLAKHKHWSPFAHPKLQFRLEMPIYVERQIIKTTVGVDYNSVSGRYVDFSDTYTTIDTWRKQSTSSKQGSGEDLDKLDNVIAYIIQDEIIENAKIAYQKLIELGVSKEQARTILPLNLNTTMIWTGSLYALIRLCNQRLKPNAQKETRDVVQEMLNQAKETNLFTTSLTAYNL